MSETIKVSEMEKVIMDALDEYKDKAEDVITVTLPLIGKETADDLKATSPKGATGNYARSWTYTMRKSRGSKKNNDLVVHNRKYYRLVHLLEHEHLKRDGQRWYPPTRDIHVKPAQEKAEKKAIERIKEKLGRIEI